LGVPRQKKAGRVFRCIFFSAPIEKIGALKKDAAAPPNAGVVKNLKIFLKLMQQTIIIQ
jgi:hypothetical protein